MTDTTTDNGTDLIAAYKFGADRESFLPSDLKDNLPAVTNMRYARELIGVLLGKGLVRLDTTGDSDVYVANIPADDDLDGYAATMLGIVSSNGNGDKPKRTPKAKEVRPCLCGCGIEGNSNYRPGHDARHAGEIGREIALNYNTKGFDRRVLLDRLPSDALKAKAEKVAETAIAKLDRKASKATAKEDAGVVDSNDDGTDAKEHGVVKVGKTEFAAVRYTATGEVEYFDGAETKKASKTAAKSFIVA